jgi:xylulokinase
MIFLGIDSGTQSTKAIALDWETGSILATAQRAYDLIDGLPPGHLEQDPENWIDAVFGCVEEVIANLGGRRAEIKGIGVSGQQHGMVALGADDKPVRAAKLWCDTSTTAHCEQFSQAFGGPEGLVALAGNAILPGYTVPKILWLKQDEPENFAKTTSVLLPHDYINFRLTGVKRMEYGDASGMGILDIRKREWCGPLIDFVDARLWDMLPEVGSSREIHGELLPELQEKWGLAPGVLVSAGGGDNMMGAIGTGNIKPGLITVSLGTSGTIYGVSDHPVADAQGEVAGFCDSTDAWLPLVCTMNVTVATEQVRKMFEWSLPELEEAVSSIPPGADGLVLLPYLNGERTPNLPGGTGVIHGLRMGNMSPAHLARAAAEGATLGLAYGMNRFREMGISPTEIRLTGGGSKSPVWRQIVADVFHTPTVALATTEGASLGGALQAGYAYGKVHGREIGYEEICQRLVALDDDSRCDPCEKASAIYAGLLERQTGIMRCLSGNGWL